MTASVVVTEAILALLGVNAFGYINRYFVTVFGYLGLPVITDYFSWTWALVWFTHAGLPFVFAWQACRSVSSRADRLKATPRLWTCVALRIALVIILLPAMVLLSRVSLLLSPDFLVRTAETNLFSVRRLVFEALVALILGLPYAGAVALCERVIAWLWMRMGGRGRSCS